MTKSDLLIPTLVERPLYFSCGDLRLCIYPLTLGKQCIIDPLVHGLNINLSSLSESPDETILALSSGCMATSMEIVAICTMNKPRDILNPQTVANRSALLMDHLKTHELATLLLHCLTMSSYNDLAQSTGIGRERELRERIFDLKGEDGGISLGALSVYGSLIDGACHRYGWTLQYVLWGISLDNLRLLLADAPVFIPLSEEESQHLGVRMESTIDAGDPKNAELIMSQYT